MTNIHVVCLFSKVVCTFTRTCVHVRVHIIIILFSTVRKYESTKVRKYENIYLRSTVVVRVALARYWYSRRLPSKVARATS